MLYQKADSHDSYDQGSENMKTRKLVLFHVYLSLYYVLTLHNQVGCYDNSLVCFNSIPLCGLLAPKELYT